MFAREKSLHHNLRRRVSPDSVPDNRGEARNGIGRLINYSTSDGITSHELADDDSYWLKEFPKSKELISKSPRLWGRLVPYKKGLLTRDELPKYLQFNPYIETGYRPLLSLWGCLLSLLYVHNETVNILTHGVPMLYIFVCWRTMIPWSKVSVPILPWTHLVSTVSPWVGSTIYHLFMNHRSGAACYKCLLHLDMFGIWITQSFGALTTVYSSVYCLSGAWIWRILVAYCFVCLWCLYKALTAESAISRRYCFSTALVTQAGLLSWRLAPTGGGDSTATLHYLVQAAKAKSPWDRRFCYTMPFLMRAASVAVRCSPFGGGHPAAFIHIFLQDTLAVIGGFIGASRIPEKWIPGCFDFLANSHHIMHVVVVYAVYHLHRGAVLDLVWLSQNSTCPSVAFSNTTDV